MDAAMAGPGPWGPTTTTNVPVGAVGGVEGGGR